MGTKSWAFLFYLTETTSQLQEIIAGGVTSPEITIGGQQCYADRIERVILEAGRPDSGSVQLLSPARADSPHSLIDFIEWAQGACPAENVVLFVSGKNAPSPADLADALTPPELAAPPITILAFDSHPAQFIELAYQLNGFAQILVGTQTDAPIRWNYAALVQQWNRASLSAGEIIASLTATGTADGHISALNLARLDDVAHAFDSLTLALLQSLGDDIIWDVAWDAPRKLAFNVTGASESALPAYTLDLKSWLQGLRAQLTAAGDNAVAGWYQDSLQKLNSGPRQIIEERIDAANLEAGHLEAAIAAALPDFPAWMTDDYTIMQSQRKRATDLAQLAERVLALLEPSADGLVLACTPIEAEINGLSIFRPRNLDRLPKSNYLELNFNRHVHWAALLGAINLIGQHPRALWRLASSLLTTAGGTVREDLLRRLIGPESVMVGFREQFRALAAPPKLTLSFEPHIETTRPNAPTSYRLRLESHETGATVIEQNSRVNLRAIDDALIGLENLLAQGWATPTEFGFLQSMGRTLGEDIIQNLSGYLEREYRNLAWLDNTSAPHLQIQLPRELMRYPWELLHDGSGLLCERYALGRQVFMQTGVARQVTRRQSGTIRALIIGDPKFSPEFIKRAAAEGRKWPQLPGAQEEAEQVALTFEQLVLTMGNTIDFDRSRDVRIHGSLTRLEFRELLRNGNYDIIHFAGHGAFNVDAPEESAWILSDGPLWAQEIRNTLAWTESPPWLVFANACESAMDSNRPANRYQGDVFGLATAFINQGVAAYIGPLWPVNDSMALQMATDFYHALLQEQTSLGEALRLAKQNAGAGLPDFSSGKGERAPAPTQAGLSWASMILYGDPTVRLMESLWTPHHLAPSIPSAPDKLPSPRRKQANRPRRLPQASVEATRALVSGPGMIPISLDDIRGAEAIPPEKRVLELVEVNGIRHWQTIDGESGAPGGLRGSPVETFARSDEARRALRLQRGAKDYLRIIGRWLLDKNDETLIENLTRQYDTDKVQTEGLLWVEADGSLTPLETDSWWWLEGNTAAETDKVLLIIHGTFSETASPVNALRGDFLAWAKKYYRGIIGFDHWTLSKSPEENAKLLWDLLDPRLKRSKNRLDIITHSRGGLVARAMVEMLRHHKMVNRVIFGCAPNSGTGLANPQNWGHAADLFANLIHLDQSGLLGQLSGLFARLADFGDKTAAVMRKVLRQIPGLWAMSPEATGSRDFLGRLQRGDGPPAGVTYSAVGVNFEPLDNDETTGGFLKFNKQKTDNTVDNFFAAFNDLVVDTARVWGVDQDAPSATPPPWLPGENLLIYNPAQAMETPPSATVFDMPGVHHTNVFYFEQTQAFLKKQLSVNGEK